VDLADQLLRYLDDPELRRAHGRQAAARVTAFARETVWASWRTEYARLLSDKGLPVPRPHPGPDA
jgi:glycosyltransferase involved in cell wall biosynthesis